MFDYSTLNQNEMNLTKTLRNQGYDLIEGPVRNHKLLQIWIKRPLNEVQLYYDHLSHAFSSDVVLTEVENTALNVDATTKDEYGLILMNTLNCLMIYLKQLSFWHSDRMLGSIMIILFMRFMNRPHPNPPLRGGLFVLFVMI